jgi:threonine/homoserine/homoserine lactone efflux protein
LITNATAFFSIWLRRRRVVMALDSAMGAILIAFGLKLAFDKAR